MTKEDRKTTVVLVCRNPRATHRFEIEERMEAGMILTGSEVKSLRRKRGDLDASFGRLIGGELFLLGMYIAPYEEAGPFGHEPRRTRKLLVRASQIEKWSSRITMRGYTIVPIQVYFKGSWA